MSTTIPDYSHTPVGAAPNLGFDFPHIAWVLGDPANRRAADISHVGGWFLAGDQGMIPPATWEPWERPTRTKEIAGFATPALTAAMIRVRKAWFYDVGGFSQRFRWTDYERAKAEAEKAGVSARGWCQCLAVVQGMDTPVVLTTKGMGSQGMLGGRGEPGVMGLLQRDLIGGLKRVIKAQTGTAPAIPLYAVWVTLAASTDSQGAPMFVTGGTGNQLQQRAVPAVQGVDLAKLVSVDHFAPFLLSADELEACAGHYLDSEGWDAEWGLGQVQAQASGVPSHVNRETGEIDGEDDAYTTDPHLAAMADAENQFGSDMPF